MLTNIVSAFCKTFITSNYAWLALLLIATALLMHRKRIFITYKILPRDLRLLKLLFKTSRHLRNFKKNTLTIIDLLEIQTSKNPKKPVFYYEDQIWTFENVYEFSNKIANIFYKEGYEKGDAVALLMSNCPEYVSIWLGLGKIGVITALINTNLKHQSLVHCIKTAHAKALIYDEEFEEVVQEISGEIDSIKKYLWGNDASQEDDKINLRQLMDCASSEPPASAVKIGVSDTIVYIYTSGTTGLPKAAILRHHKLLMIASTIHCLMDVKEDDIIYNPLPMYHISGGLGGVTGSICYGFSAVIKKKFSAGSYWPDCIKYNCTVALYIGEMCRYIVAVPPKPEDTQHKVRFVLGSGMKMSVWESFQKRFNLNIREVYGSTEGNINIVNIDNTVGAVGFLPKIIPERYLPVALIKVDELGQPLRSPEGFCLRCEPNEPGLFIGVIHESDESRQYSGYVGNKKENEKKIIRNVFKKGDKAFLSGDILVMDELGYLFFKDRIGDTFRWKGENVSTAEVEGIISSITGLRDVIVYGVEVANSEGRAGMAAISDPNLNFDLKYFEREIDRKLPPYARPLFLRLTDRLDLTGTFKLTKLNFQKQGFNPSTINEKMYFKSGSKYVDLTQNIYDDIIYGRVRV